MIDGIISTFPKYIFLSKCILYDVSLATKKLIWLVATLLTRTAEPGIEIPLGKQSVFDLKLLAFFDLTCPHLLCNSLGDLCWLVLSSFFGIKWFCLVLLLH